jgi:hypothetical protein
LFVLLGNCTIEITINILSVATRWCSVVVLLTLWELLLIVEHTIVNKLLLLSRTASGVMVTSKVKGLTGGKVGRGSSSSFRSLLQLLQT